MVRKYLFEYGNKWKNPVALRRPTFKFYNNESIYKVMMFLKWTIPYQSYKALTNVTGNEEMKKTMKILNIIDS